VKATGIESDPDILESCKNEDNDSDDDDDDVDINRNNDDDYEYPFVPGDYYDSDDENNKGKGANDDNDDNSRRKTNIYLLSQALGFTVKNKFITEKHLNKLMKIKENSKKSEK
jgi:hypothetical protein